MDGCPPVVMPWAVNVVEEVVAIEVDAPVLGRQRFVADLHHTAANGSRKQQQCNHKLRNISAVYPSHFIFEQTVGTHCPRGEGTTRTK